MRTKKILGLAIVGSIVLSLFGADMAAAECGGSVTVSESGSLITVDGDAADNCIAILLAGAMFTVTGRNGTTVVGSPLSVVNKNFIGIRLQGGNDEIRIDSDPVDSFIWGVEGDEGNDTIHVDSIDTQRFKIAGEQGNDVIILDFLSTNKSSLVSGGSGDDALNVGEIFGPMNIVRFEGIFKFNIVAFTATTSGTVDICAPIDSHLCPSG